MNLEIVFDTIILIFLNLSLCLCLVLLIIIYNHLHPLNSNVSILLIFNTYLSLFLTCITMMIIYVYNLYGDLYPYITVNDRWCQLRAYFVNVSFCALYYSCLLKSIFRFFRIIFYKYTYLQSYKFFSYAILFQWLLAFTLILYNLYNNDYEYLPSQYRCWVSFQNIRGFLIAAFIIYICPLLFILIIYIYIIRYVQKNSFEKDIIILKRITIFVFVITFIGLPTVLILCLWIITKKLIPMAYHIQGLSIAMGIFMATICFAFLTPQIQAIFYRKERNVSSPMIIRRYTQTTQKDIETFV